MADEERGRGREGMQRFFTANDDDQKAFLRPSLLGGFLCSGNAAKWDGSPFAFPEISSMSEIKEGKIWAENLNFEIASLFFYCLLETKFAIVDSLKNHQCAPESTLPGPTRTQY